MTENKNAAPAGRRRIHELPKQMADKIAAGEVVDRPLSIVKELVENSIDAGSTSIAVEIKNGGKSYIRVTDNGCGIAADETELAFKRHATSKLDTIRDLDAVATLGFRGEALASIAAVSRVELITKTADEEAGASVQIDGGMLVSSGQAGCPQGTTIIVRDLFFNTPARMKFLKKDNTESALIIDFVSKIALAYPNIRIRLINNGNTLFATQGRGDMFNTIATIYDPAMAKKLIRFHEADENGLSVEGYVSSPDETRANRKNQIFFVNGRYIQSKLLEQCIGDAYREKVFEGRHPVAFIFVTISPEQTDVNIHPNKKEIRFDDENAVREFVTAAVRNALKIPEAVPEFTFKKDKINENKQVKQPSPADRAVKQEQLDIRQILRQKRAAEDAAKYGAGSSGSGMNDKEKGGVQAGSSLRKNGSGAADVVGMVKSAAGSDGAGRGVSEGSRSAGRAGSDAGSSGGSDKKNAAGNAASSGSGDAASNGISPQAGALPQEKPEGKFMPFVSRPERRLFDVSEIRPVGVIFAEYILGCDDNSFYMIDQHAAHERVFYEKLTREFYGQQTASQMLMLPIQVNVSYSVKNAEEEWIGFLRNIGFSIEEFGPKAYAVKEIPAYMSGIEAEDFIKDFFDSLDEPGAFRDKRRADKIITRACKSAVKANDSLDPAEVAQLLKDLAECVNPFSCPHGRPTIIRMKKSEIDALFKR